VPQASIIGITSGIYATGTSSTYSYIFHFDRLVRELAAAAKSAAWRPKSTMPVDSPKWVTTGSTGGKKCNNLQ